MIKDKCVSITDLRLHTKKCLEELDKSEKYIFVNNKPVAVLMDIDDYEKRVDLLELRELSDEEITPEIRRLANEAREMDSSEFENI